MPHDHDLRVALVREHADAHAWAMRCCWGDRDAADDLLQEVYLLVLTGRAVYSGRSTFRTWLYGVIRRTGLAWRRRLRTRLAVLNRWPTEGHPTAPMSPVHRLEAEEEAARLRAALGQLSTRQRDMLMLVFYHDLTVEQAADVLGIPLGTARTHYARGKSRLEVLLR